MKRINWIIVRNFFRVFFSYTFLMFGGTVLISHYVFHLELDASTLNEKVITSLLFSVVFTLLYRSRWYKKDAEVWLFHTEIQKSQDI